MAEGDYWRDRGSTHFKNFPDRSCPALNASLAMTCPGCSGRNSFLDSFNSKNFSWAGPIACPCFSRISCCICVSVATSYQNLNHTSHSRYRGDHTYYPGPYGYAYDIGFFCCKGEIKVVHRSLRRAIRSPSALPQGIRGHGLKQGWDSSIHKP